MSGLEKWILNGDGSWDYHDPNDVEVVFEDVGEFLDPLIVCHTLGLDVLDEDSNEYRALVAGVPVHACLGCEPGRVYVVDRPNVVDAMGFCLVCGGETSA